MKIYQLHPAGVAGEFHNGFFATLDLAKAHADTVLESFREMYLRMLESDDPDERADFQVLAADLEWEWRDVSDHPEMYKDWRWAAQYCKNHWSDRSTYHLFTIKEVEVTDA